jgi:hypothetical protein
MAAAKRASTEEEVEAASLPAEEAAFGRETFLFAIKLV